MRKRAIVMLLCLTIVGGLFSGCGSGKAGEEASGDKIQETVTEDKPQGAAAGNLAEQENNAGSQADGGNADASAEDTGKTAEKTAEEASGNEAKKQDVPSSSEVSLLHPIIIECNISDTNADYEMILETEYGKLQLKPDEAAVWPKLAEALKAESEAEEAEAKKSFEANLEEAELYFEEKEYSYDLRFSSMKNVQVVRADTTVFSIRYDYTDYFGGPHGFYGFYGNNYDTATGTKLAVADVIKDTGRLSDILCEKLLALPKGQEWLDAGGLRNTLTEDAEGELYSWVIGYDGISFLFSPYSIAPFAAGSFEVKILFEEAPELFQEKYTNVPQSYVIPLNTEKPAYADVDGDGRKEEIGFECKVNYEWGDIEGIMVTVDGKSEYFDTYCYELEPYLIHVGDRNYIYTFTVHDNDISVLSCYELMADGVRQMEDQMGGRHGVLAVSYGYSGDAKQIYSYEVTEEVFTDPECFGLTSPMYSLGIIDGYRVYHVGQDGYPEEDTPYFEVSGEWKKEWIPYNVEPKTFTALVNMKMQGLNEDFSESGESVEVPAGAVLEIIRTDRESYVVFRLEDGSLVQAGIEAEEWPYTICGIQMEEALDGIIFAG